jgi:hypothetical protein
VTTPIASHCFNLIFVEYKRELKATLSLLSRARREARRDPVPNAIIRLNFISLRGYAVARPLDRITANPAIMNGQPCLRGMRLKSCRWKRLDPAAPRSGATSLYSQLFTRCRMGRHSCEPVWTGHRERRSNSSVCAGQRPLYSRRRFSYITRGVRRIGPVGSSNSSRGYARSWSVPGR